MPSPMDTELRVQDSPVPAQITSGLVGSMASAPIDCAGCLSNTGRSVVAPSVDFQMPPLAAPTNTVVLPPRLTAATAETRPLITAEPMLRAPRPESTPASKRACAAFCPDAEGMSCHASLAAGIGGGAASLAGK